VTSLPGGKRGFFGRGAGDVGEKGLHLFGAPPRHFYDSNDVTTPIEGQNPTAACDEAEGGLRPSMHSEKSRRGSGGGGGEWKKKFGDKVMPGRRKGRSFR